MDVRATPDQILGLMRSGLAGLFQTSGLLVTFYFARFLIRQANVREMISDRYSETSVGRMYAYPPDLFVMHPKKQYSNVIFFVKCAAITKGLVGLSERELTGLSLYPKDHVALIVGQIDKRRPVLGVWLSRIDVSRPMESIEKSGVRLPNFMAKLGVNLDGDAYDEFCEALSKLME